MNGYCSSRLLLLALLEGGRVARHQLALVLGVVQLELRGLTRAGGLRQRSGAVR